MSNLPEVISDKIDVEKALRVAIKTPLVKIDREKYLSSELSKYFSKETVDNAIDNNPAYAGISVDDIEKIARESIKYETRLVSSASFGLGLPGGVAMVATIPADVSQYFASTLRILQKLAYLYGFEEFDIKGDSINDNTMSQILIFMGVMFGVQGANNAITKIAAQAAQHITKKMAQHALTKTTYYPIAKTIAQKLGYTMTKQIFAKSVGKAVVVLGGVIGGGLTYATYKPCAYRLKNTLKTLPISDPETYK